MVFITREGHADLEMLIDIDSLPALRVLPGRISAIYDRQCQTFYAKATYPGPDGKHKHINIHRLIVDAPDGLVVDHRNHNGLDNRKDNLRIVTTAFNNLNRRGAARNSTTGFRGVSKAPVGWRARLSRGKKRYELGNFPTPEQASEAVNAWLVAQGVR